MAPRRKKGEAEDSPFAKATGDEPLSAPDETGMTDGFDVPAAEEPPKKKPARPRKAAVKKTAAPAKIDVPVITVSPGERDVAVPILPAPARKPESESLPQPGRIRIEPEEREEESAADIPLRKPSPAIPMPPAVLLQGRKLKNDVSDVIDEPEDDFRQDLRPQVRMGLYRTIAVGFAVLAVAVGLLVTYVAYARATVSVHPSTVEVRTERVLHIVPAPENPDDVPGSVVELTVAGEKSGAPTASTTAEAQATGRVTLINESGSDQTLIATTRLLSPEGVLFRLKARVVVPAGGRAEADVYADQPGAASEIGPTRFTIPGLSAALQRVIYAQSDAAMTGGTVATGIVRQEDIDALELALREELVEQAKAELSAESPSSWSGEALSFEPVSRSANVEAGATASDITVRLTLRVRAARYDRDKAVAIASEDLRRGLTSDRELVEVLEEEAKVTVESADPKTGTGAIRVSVSGRSAVSIRNPVFDLEKLKGRSLDDVQAYFEDIEGVERVDVAFRPYWFKRMPYLRDHIEIQIVK